MGGSGTLLAISQVVDWHMEQSTGGKIDGDHITSEADSYGILGNSRAPSVGTVDLEFMV